MCRFQPCLQHQKVSAADDSYFRFLDGRIPEAAEELNLQDQINGQIWRYNSQIIIFSTAEIVDPPAQKILPSRDGKSLYVFHDISDLVVSGQDGNLKYIEVPDGRPRFR